MRCKLIARGNWKIYAICDNDGKTFIESMLAETEQDRCVALFDRMATRGPTSIPTDRNHQIDSNAKLFQVRVNQLRIVWFYDEGQIVICAHCYRKKTNRVPKKDLQAARRAREAYWIAKNQHHLQFN